MKKRSIFDQSRSFWRGFNQACDLVIINVIFLICCIPIITIGPALTALYYTCMKSIRRGRGYLIKNFFHSFKQNFFQGSLAFIILLIIAGASGLICYQTYADAVNGGQSQIMFWLTLIIVIVAFSMGLMLFPILSRFTYKFVGLFIMSALMGMRSLLRLIVLIILFVATAAGCYFCIPFLILIGPALYTYLSSYIIEPVFAIYMPKYEEDQTEEESDENENTPQKDQWYYE